MYNTFTRESSRNQLFIFLIEYYKNTIFFSILKY